MNGGSSGDERIRQTSLRIDASTNRVTAAIDVGDGPGSVTAGEGSVWVTNRHEGPGLQQPGAGSVSPIE
jgi:hypothetical protein